MEGGFLSPSPSPPPHPPTERLVSLMSPQKDTFFQVQTHLGRALK